MSPDTVENGITVWSKRFGLILLGCFISSAYHGTLHLYQEETALQHVQAVDIPKLKAAVKCEDRRADKAAMVASNAIISANVENVPVPKFNDIPADNCPHPTAAK